MRQLNMLCKLRQPICHFDDRFGLSKAANAAIVALILTSCAATPSTPADPLAATAPRNEVLTGTQASPQNTPQGFSATVCVKGDAGIRLSLTDQFILLEGGICPGDEVKFKAFMATVPPGLRLVKLSSGGGNVRAATRIGAIIRERGFDTLVDATQNRCASACTFIFAAGIARFYAGGSAIKTGLSGRRGLGYHYLNSRRTDQTDEEKDRRFDASVPKYLAQMMVPSGAQLITTLMQENRTTKMTWLNGEEALNAGVATSLSSPLR